MFDLFFLKADTLKVIDWPTPKIKDNEVLIKVRAFGLNFADIFARKVSNLSYYSILDLSKGGSS